MNRLARSHSEQVGGWLIGALIAFALTFAHLPLFAQDAKPFKAEELDQMLAPIALYPDSLLSQVLMASTYPADVAAAAKWSKANAKQQGDAAVKAVQDENWDPSVASLVAFPSVIQTMGDQAEQTQRIGDAFLAQPNDVMDSVQRLRTAASKSGNLKTTEQQKVTTQPAAAGGSQQTIIIEPANPQVVYVPTYNPTVVYGAWWYPAYPPYYWPPPPGYAFAAGVATGIAWGIGIGITSALWGGFDWGRHDVNINVNRYNNININKRLDVNSNRVSWNHNASNRHGVPYRDQASREKFGKQVAGANNRQDLRGKVDTRSADRDRAQQTLKQRGADPATERERLRNDPQVQERARAAANNPNRSAALQQARNSDLSAARQTAQNRSADHAFHNVGNASASRQHVDRGQASRQAMRRPAGGAHVGGGHVGGRRR